MAEHSETDFGSPFRRTSGRHQLAADDAGARGAGDAGGAGGAGGAGDAGPPPAPLLYDPRDWYYDMSGDKHMLIFNHYQYKKSRYFRKQPAVRSGTARDVQRLQVVFAALGFTVHVHHDKDHDEILDLTANLCAQDHRGTSCVCVAVLTHGEAGGELLAADRPYELGDLLALLQRGHAALVGKPKLLLVQACRGARLDAGRLQLDGAAPLLPTHADTLVLASSVDDYVSWRDANGSWLIQELCRVLEATHRQLDLLQMTTLVTSLVARERASNTPSSAATHNKKQTPETRSTLTKLLRFSPPAPPAPAAPPAPHAPPTSATPGADEAGAPRNTTLNV